MFERSRQNGTGSRLSACAARTLHSSPLPWSLHSCVQRLCATLPSIRLLFRRRPTPIRQTETSPTRLPAGHSQFGSCSQFSSDALLDATLPESLMKAAGGETLGRAGVGVELEEGRTKAGETSCRNRVSVKRRGMPDTTGPSVAAELRSGLCDDCGGPLGAAK